MTKFSNLIPNSLILKFNCKMTCSCGDELTYNSGAFYRGTIVRGGELGDYFEFLYPPKCSCGFIGKGYFEPSPKESRIVSK